MTPDQELEDLCAQAMVAMSLLPQDYPAWSDGYEAHLAAMRELWMAVRPKIERSKGVIAIDKAFLQMRRAIETGNTAQTMTKAFRFHSALRAMIAARQAASRDFKTPVRLGPKESRPAIPT